MQFLNDGAAYMTEDDWVVGLSNLLIYLARKTGIWYINIHYIIRLKKCLGLF